MTRIRMNKKLYQSPTTSITSLASSSMMILTGSVTSCAIQVNNVTVEDYTPGFSDGGNDFKDISF